MNIFPPHEQRLYPFEFYSKMRHHNPVAYDGKNNLWGLFRYYDVQSVLEDHTSFSSAPPKSKNLTEDDKKQMPFMRPTLLRSDPPYHRTLRGVIASAFTPMAISKLEPRIEEITHHLLDQVIEKGRIELISELAYPLPVTVIAELLGVPVEDRSVFHRWADKLVGSSGDDIEVEHHASTPTNKAPLQNFAQIQHEMDDYFNSVINKRTTSPRNDLISGLISAEADGHHLSGEEILAFCILLLLAGHVTTVNLIGNTILSLLQNPQEFKRLKEGNNVNYSLIPSTTEETLRYRSPVQAVIRTTTRDVNLGGQKIRSGQSIIVCLGSANHDESVFPQPERFDISRNPRGHSHIGFGHGIHFCLGAPLARLETCVVLKILLERLKNLELDSDSTDGIKPLSSPFFHGVSRLPLRFKPGT